MQKLARAVIGTNNMDNCSRYCQAPATIGLFRTVGYGGDSGSIYRYRAGRPGADRRQQHGGEPSGAGHAREAGAQAARAEADRGRSARARDGATAPTLPAPASPAPIWSGCRAVTRYIFDNGLAKKEFLEQVGERDRRVSQEPRAVHAWNLPAADAALPVETLEQVARMIVEANSVCVLWAMGVTQHSHGFRYVDGDFEPAAGHRELHAARHGRLSAARAQQRAGRQRSRRDAE